MDGLQGILIAYEMRIKDPKQREVTFKSSQKNERNKNKSTSPALSSNEESDEEMANFVRNLKRGTGKYKGKIPFKCFKCGNIGHFVTKYPFNNNNEYNYKQRKRYSKGMSFFIEI